MNELSRETLFAVGTSLALGHIVKFYIWLLFVCFVFLGHINLLFFLLFNTKGHNSVFNADLM